jgi:hypothetical protein
MCITVGQFSIADGRSLSRPEEICTIGTSVNRVLRSVFEPERERERIRKD